MGLEETVVFEAPDFDTAIVGVTYDDRAVYSFSLMVQCLMRDHDMAEEEAVDFIEYNSVGALPYMGESAPVVVYDLVD